MITERINGVNEVSGRCLSRFIAFLLVFLLDIVAAHAAYQAPLGVPTPTFGIDEVAPGHPAGWPGAQETDYYYIDNTHINATDLNNTFGYPDKPRLTIPETSYAAGAYIEIHGGPYTGGGQIIFTGNGTAQKPVWFRGASASQKPVISGETIVKGSYIIMENLYYDTNGKGIGLRVHGGSSLNHVSVRNSEFAGPGIAVSYNSSVISMQGGASNRFSDIVVYNNKIHDFGDSSTGTTLENDYHGVLISQNVDRGWILNNTIYHMGGDSVQVGTGGVPSGGRVKNIYIAGNTFHDDGENAVDVKQADDVIISENHMYGYAPRYDRSNNGAIVIIHLDPSNVWVLNNTVHTGTYGIMATGSTNTWFIGNRIYNIHHEGGSEWNPDRPYSYGAAIHFRGSSTGGVVNNTIYNYDTGIQLTTALTGYEITGNIFAERAELTGWDVKVALSSIASNTTIDYNLFYSSTGSARIDWANNSTAEDIAAFKVNQGKCLNCIGGRDPLFVDVASGDFSLLAGSPAVDTGSLSGAYATFFNLYGISISKDIDGVFRPAQGAWDMGAIELKSLPPSPPTNLKIDTVLP